MAQLYLLDVIMLLAQQKYCIDMEDQSKAGSFILSHRKERVRNDLRTASSPPKQKKMRQCHTCRYLSHFPHDRHTCQGGSFLGIPLFLFFL